MIAGEDFQIAKTGDKRFDGLDEFVLFCFYLK